MNRKPCTRDQDKALWCMSRLVQHPTNPSITLARFVKLGQEYERLNPRGHTAPLNVKRYGHRLDEKALALYAR